MALTVGEIIKHMRDMHPALSKQNTPLPLCVRACSRMQHDLLLAACKRTPAYAGLLLTVTLPLPVFSDGIDLTTEIPGGWIDLLEGFAQRRATSDTTQWPMRMQSVPWEQRDMPQLFPGYTLRNNVIYLMGGESDWSQIGSVRFTYTPHPDDLVDDTSTLILSDDVRDAMATMLASFFLERMVDEPTYRVTGTVADRWAKKAADEETTWLNRISHIGVRQSYRVRDVT